MTAEQAEAYIRSQLDGWFVSLKVTGGDEAVLRVFKQRVPEDFLPGYDLIPDETEQAQKHVLKRPSRAKPWSDAEDGNLIRMRQEGGRWCFIARELRRAISFVRVRYAELAAERNLPPVTVKKGNFSQMTAEQKAQVLALRAQGKTFDQISKELDLRGYVARDYYHRYQRYLREKRREAA
jgi:hypothetical protein